MIFTFFVINTYKHTYMQMNASSTLSFTFQFVPVPSLHTYIHTYIQMNIVPIYNYFSLLTNRTKGDESHCSNCFIREREVVGYKTERSAGEVRYQMYIHAYIHTHTYIYYLICIQTNNIHTYIHTYQRLY